MQSGHNASLPPHSVQWCNFDFQTKDCGTSRSQGELALRVCSCRAKWPRRHQLNDAACKNRKQHTLLWCGAELRQTNDSLALNLFESQPSQKKVAGHDRLPSPNLTQACTLWPTYTPPNTPSWKSACNAATLKNRLFLDFVSPPPRYPNRSFWMQRVCLPRATP